jgi:hypothetical protein
VKNSVKRAFIFRLVIRLLFSKFAITKDLLFDSDFTVFRYALGFGCISAVYRIVRNIIQRRRSPAEAEKVKAQGGCDLEFFLSTAISGVGFLVMKKMDRKVFKVLLYSEAMKAFVRLVGDKTGWFKPIKEFPREGQEPRHFTVESGIAYLSIVFIAYMYLFNIKNLSKSMLMTLFGHTGTSERERTFFDALRAITEAKARGL